MVQDFWRSVYFMVQSKVNKVVDKILSQKHETKEFAKLEHLNSKYFIVFTCFSDIETLRLNKQ